MLIKWTAIPGYKNATWFEALRVLFQIKNKLDKTADLYTKKGVESAVFNKISEFLQIMSTYVEFEQVIEVLLKSDRMATFKYANKWFTNLFISKNDQEFLYRSAKILLSHENSQMIDTIV